MIIKLANLGSLGAIKDLPPWEIPPEAFSDALNVRFSGGSIDRIDGQTTVFNITISAATATQNLAEAPWFLMPVDTESDYYWLVAGQKFIHAVDATTNRTMLNKTASGSTVTYSATENGRWTGAVLGGLPILTNGANPPQIQTSIGFTQRFQDLQWDDSAGTTWATRSAGAVTCEVFRTFLNYGLALKTNENGVKYDRRIRWSHPVISKTQPASWDDNRSDIDASYKDFDETGDTLVDSAPLYDFNIVYKANTTWIQRYIGGQYVFSFNKLYDHVGLLAPECAKPFFGKHFAVTGSDVVVHNGQDVESVIQKRWRDYLFNNLDGNYYKRTFTAIDYQRQEIWICYPESGVISPYWPNMALIWNWREGTWSHRELPSISHIATGRIEFSTVNNALDKTYANTGTTYDTEPSRYGEQLYSTNQYQMLGASPSATVPALWRMNDGVTFAGTSFISRLERQGLAIIGQDRQGNPEVMHEPIKHCRGLWPYIEAEDGMEFQVWIGSQFHLNEPVSWSGPFTFTVGTNRWVRCRVTGRFLSYRVQTSQDKAWKLTSIDIDVVTVGNR